MKTRKRNRAIVQHNLEQIARAGGERNVARAIERDLGKLKAFDFTKKAREQYKKYER